MNIYKANPKHQQEFKSEEISPYLCTIKNSDNSRNGSKSVRCRFTKVSPMNSYRTFDKKKEQVRNNVFDSMSPRSNNNTMIQTIETNCLQYKIVNELCNNSNFASSLKSDIMSMRELIDKELTLDMKFEIEHKGKEESYQTDEENLLNFINNNSSFSEIQKKFDSIKEESKDANNVIEKLNCDHKNEAIIKMFETLSLIEVLWNQMIALELMIVYKENKHKSVFSKHISSELNQDLIDINKGLNSRISSYK